ncbi:hypothetical protein [Neptuniibacter halophilus]|uniref:hypothetical protein n=1 Tax=Neptuniibacter halophilus TaxID=651666 RepID=UPI0025738DDE|nr:hypothetical protein [Neptuniibacter halophilus]
MEFKVRTYWIVYPVKTSIKHAYESGLTAYDSQQVIAGSSPLGDLGELFYQMLHMRTSLYEALWMFPERHFETQGHAEAYCKIHQLIIRALYGCAVSGPGVLLEDANDPCRAPIRQTPGIRVQSPSKRPAFELPELSRVMRLADRLAAMDAADRDRFLSVIDYLGDIRESPVFVGQLALWSFVEHYWRGEDTKTSDDRSLSHLLSLVCDTAERREFNIKVRQIGGKLGSPCSENKLRNILAHGKHLTLQANWDNDDWTSFYAIHDQLFQIAIRGVEAQITQNDAS